MVTGLSFPARVPVLIYGMSRSPLRRISSNSFAVKFSIKAQNSIVGARTNRIAQAPRQDFDMDRRWLDFLPIETIRLDNTITLGSGKWPLSLLSALFTLLDNVETLLDGCFGVVLHICNCFVKIVLCPIVCQIR